MRALGSMSAPKPESRDADEIHWTITGQSSVTFDWRGPADMIRFGTTIDYDRAVTAVTPDPLPFSSEGPFWEARLGDLQENTVYHYAIGDGPDHTFRTPPPRGRGGFRIFAEADIGDAGSYRRMGIVQSQIAAGQPDFVLVAGDIAYANAHGQSAVDRHFNDVMVWSQDAAYMPAWGNHEWDVPLVDDLRNYKGRFDVPNARTSPGSPDVSCCGEDWYWFDYGNTRFIAYPEPWTGAWRDWQAEAAGLMDEAQNDPAIMFIITFGHRPAYSSGHHPGSSQLAGYLDALGARFNKYVLNINGHSHNYERSYPQNGVVHVTAGGGGGSLEIAHTPDCLWLGGCPAPSWSAARAMRHGPVKLTISDKTIEGEAICGPAGDGRANRNDIECELGSSMDRFVIVDPNDRPPLVSTPKDADAKEAVPATISVRVSDPDGDSVSSLTADLSALPPGNDAVFTVDESKTSGVLTWTPRYEDAGVYTVTFMASNYGIGSATTTIEVENSDRPPELSSPPNVSTREGDTIDIDVTASDPDGEVIESLEADLAGLPPGNDAAFRSQSSGSATLSWTPALGTAREEPYTVQFLAANASIGVSFTSIRVLPGNRPPIATLDLPPGTGEAPFRVEADASSSNDTDGSIVSYRFDFGDGTVLGPGTEPRASHTYSEGAFTASVTVVDNEGAASTASVPITVQDLNEVQNPSFEESSAGWGSINGSVLSRVRGGYDGEWSLLAEGSARSKFGANDSPNWIPVSHAAKDAFRFTAWVRSETSTGKAQLRIREYLGNAQRGTTVFSRKVKLSPQWQVVTVDYVCRDGGSNIDFQILDDPAARNEEFQMDAISIEKLPPGSAAER